jgi:hypothetical protein
VFPGRNYVLRGEHRGPRAAPACAPSADRPVPAYSLLFCPRENNGNARPGRRRSRGARAGTGDSDRRELAAQPGGPRPPAPVEISASRERRQALSGRAGRGCRRARAHVARGLRHPGGRADAVRRRGAPPPAPGRPGRAPARPPPLVPAAAARPMGTKGWSFALPRGGRGGQAAREGAPWGGARAVGAGARRGGRRPPINGRGAPPAGAVPRRAAPRRGGHAAGGRAGRAGSGDCSGEKGAAGHRSSRLCIGGVFDPARGAASRG